MYGKHFHYDVSSQEGSLQPQCCCCLFCAEFQVLSKCSSGCNTAVTDNSRKTSEPRKHSSDCQRVRLPNVPVRNPVDPSSVDVRPVGRQQLKRSHFKSCGMRRCFGSWVASDVSKDRYAFIFQSKQSKPPKKTASHRNNLKSRSPKLSCHSSFFCISRSMHPFMELKRQESDAHHCFHRMHSSRLCGALLHISLHLPVLSYYLIAIHYFERPARTECFTL